MTVPMGVRVGACLSRSGTWAPFGEQAAQALRVWRTLTNSVEVIVADDRSSARTLAAILPEVAARCDVLLGPYGTRLAATAAGIAVERGLVLFNHGGAGDHVHTRYPGHVVSVLTPASRYAEPFLARLASDPGRLCIVPGRGRFGRQVATGVTRLAARLHLESITTDTVPEPAGDEPWHLLAAGSFDEDVQAVDTATRLAHPPRTVCAVAAGVSRFSRAVPHPEGIFGIGQWFPGRGDPRPPVGPEEAEFVSRFTRLTGTAPDYPAIQAVAAAALAVHCLHLANSARQDALWAAASSLHTRTLFGPFRIDPTTGTQLAHDTCLVRWTAEGARAAG